MKIEKDGIRIEPERDLAGRPAPAESKQQPFLLKRYSGFFPIRSLASRSRFLFESHSAKANIPRKGRTNDSRPSQ
jgi:hypothetical protein